MRAEYLCIYFQDVLVKLDKFLSDIGSEERRIDAIIVAVMGHGLENDRIITSDGEDIHIFKEILERFGNRKCPKLEGVPQIFLIQKCRYVQRNAYHKMSLFKISHQPFSGDHLDISLEKATNGYKKLRASFVLLLTKLSFFI